MFNDIGFFIQTVNTEIMGMMHPDTQFVFQNKSVVLSTFYKNFCSNQCCLEV